MNPTSTIGIIGGSGLYQIDGLEDPHWEQVNSPFGKPSDELLFSTYAGHPVVFLPRHGRGHVIPPSEINYRANIDAMKRAGVTDLISVSAVGSLRENLKPGMFVIVDQFIDRTFAREKSFFGRGCVAHVSMAHPVCDRLGAHLYAAASKAGTPIEMVRGGTYLVMEGPQFSSLAESELYRSWNCDVIGMTNMPEAKLAREAEMCFATVAMVTDFDCWHPSHEDVTIDQIIRVLTNNADKARSLVKNVIAPISEDMKGAQCQCKSALDFAIVTALEHRDPSLMLKLDTVAKRILNKS